MKTSHSVTDLIYKNSLEPADQTIHVLHVDDEEDFLKTAKQILEMQDQFQVETASSVEEAIKKLGNNSFDVIVSDYQMPQKNGMDFLKEIRESGNNIPFILFTGKGREEVAIEALNLGADYYFNKSGKTETVYGELAHGIRVVVKARKAEEKLKESEMLYRLLTENITDAIFIQDMQLNVKYVSSSVEKLSGYTPEEILKLRPEKFMTPESFERGVTDFKEAIALAMEKPDAVIPLKQYEYKRKDGSTFWGELRTKMLRDSTGRLVGLHGTLRDITERKKAEDALRQEREMLELVTTNIGAGLTIISKDYKILWANKFLRNVFGTVIGKTCYSIYNDRTSVCPGCGVKEIFETGKDHVVNEQSVPAANGQRVWIELTANPIKDEKGKIIAVSELSVNLDERKKIEIKLRDAEKRYHALFDKAPLGILIVDSNGIAVEFNDAAHRQLGYSREEFEKLTVSDYEVLETPDETKARMRKILKVGKDEFETKHRTKNGKIRNIINTVQVIELDGKKFFHIITRDITEHKKAEERLMESEEKYREIINAMNDTVWVIDFDGTFIDANDTAVAVLGYSREEVLSMGVKDIDSNLDPKQIKVLVKTMLNGEMQVFETIHTTKDGKTIPVEISSSLVTYKGKQAILSIARDITKRKEAEQKLSSMMEELTMVNEKLGVVGKLARHDARNKLSVIANKVYLIKQQLAGDPTSLEYLDDIESAIDQIETILSFARIYEMLGVNELSYVNAEKFIGDAAKLFSGINGVKLVNDCSGLTVLADSLLWQLFYNLIDNSLKHGEKVTQIRVYYEEGKDQLKLIYEDNGVGIPKTEKEKIFMERYGKGTGYGLYLIRKMCEVYGWAIAETGKRGKGAQFTMTIPKMGESKKFAYIL